MLDGKNLICVLLKRKIRFITPERKIHCSVRQKVWQNFESLHSRLSVFICPIMEFARVNYINHL
jgi:hypothetical protein